MPFLDLYGFAVEYFWQWANYNMDIIGLGMNLAGMVGSTGIGWLI